MLQRGKDELLAEALHYEDEGLAVFLRREFPNVLAETSPWRDRCFHLWEKTWKFILGERDDCIFYLRYYSSPDFYAYERDRQQQYYHALIPTRHRPFRPETDLDMLMHQIFETMLAFAAHVMAGDMENNDLTTERTFEQIYSFIAPHFRASTAEGAGKGNSGIMKKKLDPKNVECHQQHSGGARGATGALLLVGARLFGLQVYTVLSGSMEPTYHTGSLIYVKKVDPYTIRDGQVITFMLDENTIATHRVVGVVPDEEDSTVVRFRTKGGANETETAVLCIIRTSSERRCSPSRTSASSQTTSSIPPACMWPSRPEPCS